MRHQHPIFQSTRRITILILKGNLNGTRQNQMQHPEWRKYSHLLMFHKNSLPKVWVQRSLSSIQASTSSSEPTQLFFLLKDLDWPLRGFFVFVFFFWFYPIAWILKIFLHLTYKGLIHANTATAQAGSLS